MITRNQILEVIQSPSVGFSVDNYVDVDEDMADQIHEFVSSQCNLYGRIDYLSLSGFLNRLEVRTGPVVQNIRLGGVIERRPVTTVHTLGPRQRGEMMDIFVKRFNNELGLLA